MEPIEESNNLNHAHIHIVSAHFDHHKTVQGTPTHNGLDAFIASNLIGTEPESMCKRDYMKNVSS